MPNYPPQVQHSTHQRSLCCYENVLPLVWLQQKKKMLVLRIKWQISWVTYKQYRRGHMLHLYRCSYSRLLVEILAPSGLKIKKRLYRGFSINSLQIGCRNLLFTNLVSFQHICSCPCFLLTTHCVAPEVLAWLSPAPGKKDVLVNIGPEAELNSACIKYEMLTSNCICKVSETTTLL